MPGSSRIVLFLAAAFGTVAAQTAQRPAIASVLEPGMQLVYANEGVETPPWLIDSVVRDVNIGDRAGCIRLRLRVNPTRAVPDTRVHCVDSVMMFNWDSTARVLRPARPLGAGSTLDIPNSRGHVRFEAGSPTMERVRVERGSARDSISVVVIPTTVTTFDSSGKAIRRLRERFSVALATATGGIFEVADSSDPSGWRVNQRFELAAIRRH